MNNIKQIWKGKIAKTILTSLAALVLALVIFSAGMLVGFRKARFSYQWGENYHRLFGMPSGVIPNDPHRAKPPFGLPRDIRGDNFINPNSAIGSVIKTDSSTLLIKGDDNTEKNIAISAGTIIRKGRDTIQLKDLKPDDKVVILGIPSSTGQIEAKLIRVF